MKRRQLTTAQLRGRRDELGRIVAMRPLTPSERAERDNLDHRFYMREWHRQLRTADRDIRRSALG
jgi:hypothetical protein